MRRPEVRIANPSWRAGLGHVRGQREGATPVAAHLGGSGCRLSTTTTADVFAGFFLAVTLAGADFLAAAPSGPSSTHRSARAPLVDDELLDDGLRRRQFEEADSATPGVTERRVPSTERKLAGCREQQTRPTRGSARVFDGRDRAARSATVEQWSRL